MHFVVHQNTTTTPDTFDVVRDPKIEVVFMRFIRDEHVARSAPTQVLRARFTSAARRSSGEAAGTQGSARPARAYHGSPPRSPPVP